MKAEVFEYFIENELSLVTKIYDNKINIYNDFKINYIKVYGTKNKYFGSNREILSELTKLIKDFNSVELLKKLQKNDKYQFIYFNNIEGDLYDNRYSEEHIVSHNGNKINCISINNPKKILDYIDSFDIFAFDETQFFNNSIIEIFNQLAINNKRVIIAGLDKDFNAKPFGPMPDILSHADNITKLHAICIKCGDIGPKFGYQNKDNGWLTLNNVRIPRDQML